MTIPIKHILSIIGLVCFLFLAIGSIGEDDVCNLDGCDRTANGWQYDSTMGGGYGQSCYRTTISF